MRMSTSPSTRTALICHRTKYIYNLIGEGEFFFSTIRVTTKPVEKSPGTLGYFDSTSFRMPGYYKLTVLIVTTTTLYSITI